MFHIPPVSRALDEAIRRAIDSKTKPPGALGVVEAVAAQIARVQNTLTPQLRSCRLTLFAGDHGIAAESVSAYPQAVPRQMVTNFLAGGPIEAPGLVSRRIAAGTRNFAGDLSECLAAGEHGLVARRCRGSPRRCWTCFGV